MTEESEKDPDKYENDSSTWELSKLAEDIDATEELPRVLQAHDADRRRLTIEVPEFKQIPKLLNSLNTENMHQNIDDFVIDLNQLIILLKNQKEQSTFNLSAGYLIGREELTATELVLKLADLIEIEQNVARIWAHVQFFKDIYRGNYEFARVIADAYVMSTIKFDCLRLHPDDDFPDEIGFREVLIRLLAQGISGVKKQRK